MKVKLKSLSRVRLFAIMDCSPPGFSVHGIFQARVLEWVAISFSRESSWPRDQTLVSCRLIPCHLSYSEVPKVKVKFAQSCWTLCNPMNYTAHGILQARILKRVAFPSSQGSSQPRDWTQVSRIAGGFFSSWATTPQLKILHTATKIQDPKSCS